MPLASVDSKKAPIAKVNCHQPPGLSPDRKKSMERRANISARAPFNWAIQATLSTLTGCNAKTAAANIAPGARSRTSIRQSKSAETACAAMFTKWKPIGFRPQIVNWSQ